MNHGALSSPITVGWRAGANFSYFVMPKLSVGLDIGASIGFSSTTILTAAPVNSTAATFVFGPNVGYDFPIMDMLSIGAEVDCLFNTTAIGSPTLQALANVKYRF